MAFVPINLKAITYRLTWILHTYIDALCKELCHLSYGHSSSLHVHGLATDGKTVYAFII